MVKLLLIASLAFTSLNGGGDEPKKDGAKAKTTTVAKKKTAKKATCTMGTKMCCEGKDKTQCKPTPECQ